MKKYGVVITSSINTKFGVYTPEQRLEQTLRSIGLAREKIPNCKIFLVETAGVALEEYQKEILTSNVDHLIDFTSDSSVVDLYNSTDNWDVVKNVTEVLCFPKALKTIMESSSAQGIERLFKISGRYLLNDNFDINYYEDYKVSPFIVVAQSKTSQFPFSVTEIEKQYMCRLWSWPTTLNSEIIEVYINSLNYMFHRLSQGGYADIEHCLYKFLDHQKIIEKGTIGVSGTIAPNGAPINE